MPLTYECFQAARGIITDYSGLADTDKEGLYDFEEIDCLSTLFTVDSYGEVVEYPTFAKCLNARLGKEFYVDAGLEKYKEYLKNENQYTTLSYLEHLLNETRVLPIHSDPTSADGDGDGVFDKDDSRPLSCITNDVMNLSFNTKKMDIEYNFDYSYFFRDNTVYNKELGITSSVFAATAYDNIKLDSCSNESVSDVHELMSYHGFSSVETRKLCDIYSDQHITDVTIGSKKVTYNGETKYIIAIAVRGTNGTVEEWSSNFDIGTSMPIYDNNDNIVPKNSAWIHLQNHMGFDIAATRVTRIINEYISTKCDPFTPKVLWITGHSRGAAIANILGANFSDTYTSFVYTFAAPNTTTAPNANRFRNIFNIVNADDIIPELPLLSWDFHKYGITKTWSMGDNYQSKWERITGEGYKYNIEGKTELLEQFGTLADTRDDCYKYTCSCHGDGSDNRIQIEMDSLDLIKYGKDYCKIEFESYHHDQQYYITCQTTAYFMQYLAELPTKGLGMQIEQVLLTPLASKYTETKWGFVKYAAFKNMHCPHYAETYYMLTRRI